MGTPEWHPPPGYVEPAVSLELDTPPRRVHQSPPDLTSHDGNTAPRHFGLFGATRLGLESPGFEAIGPAPSHFAGS